MREKRERKGERSDKGARSMDTAGVGSGAIRPGTHRGTMWYVSQLTPAPYWLRVTCVSMKSPSPIVDHTPGRSKLLWGRGSQNSGGKLGEFSGELRCA